MSPNSPVPKIHRRIRVLSESARNRIAPQLLNVIENRKSGLSLNHIVGCPLNCAYCVRHLFDNFEMKQPHLLMSDEAAVSALVSHKYFRPHVTPVQLFNRATDPFLPPVKEHTFRVLQILSGLGLTNHVLVITRFMVTAEDVERLNNLGPLKLSLLFTYSGIQDRKIEPFDAKYAAESLQRAFRVARNYRAILYWRPLIVGVNDTSQHIAQAAALSQEAHATVFTGLFYRDAMQLHFSHEGIPAPYQRTARRKILPRRLENQVIAGFFRANGRNLFRKTSCGVAFAHKEPDFNGHYGIRELCDICPNAQIERCAASFVPPSREALRQLMSEVGIDKDAVIAERAITFEDLDEEPRYFIQHSLRFQVHDRRHPHYHGRHGRAEIGWESDDDD